MTRQGGAVHVATTSRHYKDKVYETHLLRRSFREGGKVKNETLANLSHLPAEAIDAVRSVLRGERVVRAGDALDIVRSLPHGDVAAVWAMARQVDLAKLLGPPSPRRDLAMALVVSRVVRPASKLSTARWWSDTTLGVDLAIADASTDEVYAAMDWLVDRQDAIETALATRHLSVGENPRQLALYDLSSSWMEGSCCPLTARGYSRDHKGGKAQIEYGLLCDAQGRPISIKVFPGNTADPSAFIDVVETVRTRFHLEHLVMVGDRGMITSARIGALKEVGGLGWVTSLRAPAIAKLAQQDGPLQPSLFDETNLATLTHSDYPGERLVACRNPLLAAERTRKREELLCATEELLAPITAAVAAGTLRGADAIGLKVGKVINRRKMAKHIELSIGDDTFTYARKGAQIAAEAALDGIYVVRTSVEASELDSPDVVTVYKSLAGVERAFLSMKADDLDLRPIRHHLEDRVRAHVLIAMLAYYLVWHLRRAWAELTFTDEERPTPQDPVAPARRSASAAKKAARKENADEVAVRSFGDLLEHLGTLTRNDVVFAGSKAVVPMLTASTPTQRRAFELLGVAVPLKLTT
jgi:Transposase DDE domain